MLRINATAMLFAVTAVFTASWSGAAEMNVQSEKTTVSRFKQCAQQFGEAAIELAYARDELSSLIRTAGLGAPLDAQSVAGHRKRIDQATVYLDALGERYLKVYRLVIGAPKYGASPPLSAEETAMRADETAVSEAVRSLGEDLGELVAELTALRTLIGKQTASGNHEGDAPRSGYFTFSLLGTYLDGWDALIQRAEPLLGPVNDYYHQQYVLSNSLKPGEYDFSHSDRAIATPLNGGKPLELVVAAAVAEWRLVPSWFADAHKDKPSYLLWPGAHPHAWDIWNPQVVDAHTDWVRAVARHYHGNSRVQHYKTVWEPTMGNRQAMAGYTTAAQKAFTQYLQTIYDDIDRLNARWGSSYATFTEIEVPSIEQFDRITPRVAAFRRFRLDSFAAFVRQDYQTFQQLAPDHPVAVSPCTAVFPNAATGIDLWQLYTRATDIISLHYWFNDVTEDIFLHSVNRYLNKTIGNLEFYWNGSHETWGKYDEDRAAAAARRNLWQLSAYGRRDFSVYGLRDTFIPEAPVAEMKSCVNMMDFYTDYTRLRRSAGELPMLIRKLHRCEPHFEGSRVADTNVALFYPSSSLKNETNIYSGDNSVRASSYLVHRILYRDNYPYVYLPEDALLEKKDSLSNYKILITPSAAYVDSGINRQVEQWVKDGGVLVVVGQLFGVYDELGLRTDHLLKQVFGEDAVQYPQEPYCRPTEVRLSAKAPIGSVHRYGKGRIVMASPDPVDAEYEQFAAQLTSLLDELTPRAAWTDAENLRFVVRDDKDDPSRRYLVAWNSSIDDNVAGRLFAKGAYTRAVDLGVAGGFAFEPAVDKNVSAFTLVLGPGEGTIILLQHADR